jgi:hypothetical protein
MLTQKSDFAYVTLILLAIIFLCFAKTISHVFMLLLLFVSGMLIMNYILNSKKIHQEEFQDYQKYQIGSYDGKMYQASLDSRWRHDPANLPLIPKNSNMTVSHGRVPIGYEQHPAAPIDATENAPTVDGEINSPTSLFTLSRNQCRPECCPSTYSCSNGCICTNNKQRMFINNRGVTHPTPYQDYPEI